MMEDSHHLKTDSLTCQDSICVIVYNLSSSLYSLKGVKKVKFSKKLVLTFSSKLRIMLRVLCGIEHLSYKQNIPWLVQFQKFLLSPQFVTGHYKNLELSEMYTVEFQKNCLLPILLKNSLHLEHFKLSWARHQTLSRNYFYFWFLLLCSK